MKKTLTLIVVLFVIVIGMGFTKEEWKKDIEYLRDIIYAEHPDIIKTDVEREFNLNYKMLMNKIDILNESEIVAGIKVMLITLGDTHTRFDDNRIYDGFNLSYSFPIYFGLFEDGFYLKNTIKEYEEMLGGKLVSINGKNVEEMLALTSPLCPIKDPNSIKKEFLHTVRNADFFKYMDIIKENKIEVAVEKGGKVIIKEVKSMSTKDIIDVVSVAAVKDDNSNDFIKINFLNDKKSIYVTINSLISRDMLKNLKFVNGIEVEKIPYAKDIKKELSNVIAGNSKINNIIFDLSKCQGGAQLVIDALINPLLSSGKLQEFRKKGKIIIVTGGETAWTAIVFINQLKETFPDSIIVGSQPEEKRYFNLRTKFLNLPNTSLLLRYNTFSYGNDEMLVPDIKVEYKWEDYKNGKDTIREYVLNKMVK